MEPTEEKELVPLEEKSSIEEFIPPSPGEDLLERIRKKELAEEEKIADNYYASKIIDGVEVVDVKAVPSKEKPKLDKFGIPEPNERRTWDKI